MSPCIGKAIVLVGDIGQSVGAVGQIQQTLVGVHTRPVYAKDRLRQKCRQETMPLCNSLDGVAGSDDGVGGLACRERDKVYLMLPGGDLVMTGFDLDSHLRQLQHDFMTYIGCQVIRQIKVASAV